MNDLFVKITTYCFGSERSPGGFWQRTFWVFSDYRASVPVNECCPVFLTANAACLHFSIVFKTFPPEKLWDLFIWVSDAAALCSVTLWLPCHSSERLTPLYLCGCGQQCDWNRCSEHVLQNQSTSTVPRGACISDASEERRFIRKASLVSNSMRLVPT